MKRVNIARRIDNKIYERTNAKTGAATNDKMTRKSQTTLLTAKIYAEKEPTKAKAIDPVTDDSLNILRHINDARRIRTRDSKSKLIWEKEPTIISGILEV